MDGSLKICEVRNLTFQFLSILIFVFSMNDYYVQTCHFFSHYVVCNKPQSDDAKNGLKTKLKVRPLCSGDE